jgi:ribonuclease HI
MLNDLHKSDRKGTVRRDGERIDWNAPPPGQLKINSDGSFIQETMQGSWGFIVRDHDGEVVLAGADHIGSIPDAFTAEAAACAQALQAATDQGISRVQVEVDSTVLQQALQTSSMDLATCGMLLRDTRALLNEHLCA